MVAAPLKIFCDHQQVQGIFAVGLSIGDPADEGALGLVKGALLLFLVVWALQKWQLFIAPEVVEKSFLLKFFAANSPMDLIAKL